MADVLDSDLVEAKKLLGDLFDKAMKLDYERLSRWYDQVELNASDEDDYCKGLRIVMRKRFLEDYQREFRDDKKKEVFDSEKDLLSPYAK